MAKPPMHKTPPVLAWPALSGISFALMLLATLASTPAAARTYYIDARRGDDGGPGTAPRPWRTIGRIEAANLQPGDKVLLRAGQTWYEQLRIGRSGTAAAPIRFGRYGTGGDPVISGAWRIDPQDWHRADDGIWSAPLDHATPSNQLYAGDEWVEPARFPDTGFLLTTTKSPNNYTVISDSLGDAVGDHRVVDAELVMKVTDYAARTARIVSWNGRETLRVAPGFANTTYSLVQYAQNPGFGFYLRGMPWMLRRPGQWVLDGSTLRLRLAGDRPPTSTTIALAQRDYGIVLDNVRYVSIEGIAVQYARIAGILGRSASAVILRGVSIEGANTGIECACTDTQVLAARISGPLAYGIDMTGDGNTVENSRITEIATRPVAPDSFMPAGIWLRGSNIRAAGNTVENSAYIGIRAEGIYGDASSGRNVAVVDNVIGSTCLRYNDCAAIYSWLPDFDARSGSGLIAGNRITDSLGNPEGTTRKSSGHGIYLDHGQHSYVVRGNLVINAGAGIFVNGGYDNIVSGNRVLASRDAAVWIYEYPEMPQGYTRGNVVRDNVLESLSRERPPAYWLSTVGHPGRTGTSDGNVYCHPNFAEPVMVVTRPDGAKRMRLDDRRRSSGDDAASRSIAGRCRDMQPAN